MQDIWKSMVRLTGEQPNCMIARVISTWGSAPRRPGSALVITPDNTLLGSVSGGCIESAVVHEAENVRRTGTPVSVTYGVADETAWSVGLTCGGQVRVLIEPHWADQATDIWHAMQVHAENKQPATLITRVTPEPATWLINANGDLFGSEPPVAEVTEKARRLARQNGCELVEVSGETFLLHSLPVKPHLVIVGAGHISVSLAKFAVMTGFEVTVLDPRAAFINAAAFQDVPVERHTVWPEKYFNGLKNFENMYVVLLSHDPKIDDPVFPFLAEHSESVCYIGALGSRKTTEKRRVRLLEKGFDAALIDRIHAPIGLPIGAVGADQIALSVIAQLVQVKNSRNA